MNNYSNLHQHLLIMFGIVIPSHILHLIYLFLHHLVRLWVPVRILVPMILGLIWLKRIWWLGVGLLRWSLCCMLYSIISMFVTSWGSSTTKNQLTKQTQTQITLLPHPFTTCTQHLTKPTQTHTYYTSHYITNCHNYCIQITFQNYVI